MKREKRTKKEILDGILSKIETAESVPVSFDQQEVKQIRKIIEGELRHIAPEYSYD